MELTPEQKQAILSDKSLMREIIGEYLKLEFPRENTVRFKCTDAERAYIQAKAQERNQDISEFIRSLVLA